jgi:glycine cleavage system aminomethyltransferase T
MTDQVRSEKVLKISPYVPYDPDQYVHVHSEGSVIVSPASGGEHPFEYTDWRDECLSWHENCYIHAGLNPTPTYRLKGPDALKLLSDVCVNSMESFPVGTGKHGIMCNESGLVMQHGVPLRVDEDEFITYWMWPVIEFALKKGDYDVVGENLTGSVFLYQMGGPRSLEVVEAATGENLHDIKFMHARDSQIAGRKVRVFRMGMAGSLAYEVHGRVEDAIAVYTALLEAGEQFGVRRMGRHAYRNTHTENGFPQLGIHFPFMMEDPEFLRFLGSLDINGAARLALTGSMGPNLRLRYRNPVELGWGAMIKFDHDFVGRAALEKEMANPSRQMVTLVWNPEDILDVYRSQFEPGEPYLPMEFVEDFSYVLGSNEYRADQVLKDGGLVGMSTGRMFSPHYRDMISLCSIDTAHSALGTEVTVLWGDPGTRQKEIRAIVSRFPYLNEDRNESFDVNTIPYTGAGTPA